MLYFAPWKSATVIAIAIIGILFALPNVLPQSVLNAVPNWAPMPRDQIVLGLDLRGGAHMLLEVDVDEVYQARLESVEKQARQVLRGERPPVNFRREVRDDAVVFQITRPEQVSIALERLQEIVATVPSGGLALGTATPDLEITQDGENRIVIGLTDQEKIYRASRAVEQSINVIGSRINELGTLEPTIQRQGERRIIVQVPGAGAADIQRIKRLITDTAKMTFHLVDVEVTQSDIAAGRIPAGTVVKDSVDGFRAQYAVKREALLTGESLADAYPTTDETGSPAVGFRFDGAGGKIFGDVTSENVGRPFAIVLDDNIVSAPTIRTAILGGSGIITGSFTFQEANDLAIKLSAGALPAALAIVEERSVGPDLGADSIAAGQLAGIVGLIAVVVFMIVYYGRFGIYSVTALSLNIILITAALSVLGATLTLPGIAGIVLTIGMAVDANVLVFERVREEIDSGKTPVNAIEAGYSRALGTILDANVTTLIAAVILFSLGSGPIRGFAVTLGIGIVTSVFTAVVVTRFIVARWVRSQRPSKVSFGFRMMPKDTHVKFMPLSRLMLPISGMLVAASIVALATLGLNLGIDFKGGTMIEVKTNGGAGTGEIRGIVSNLGFGDVQVQEFGAPDDILIRIEEQPGGDEAQQGVVEVVKSTFAAELGDDIDYRRVEVVGPKVGDELMWNGIIAVVSAILAILAYIWFRFDPQFGLGAIVALVHDVVITLGVFSVLGLEFGLPIIAALLTIAGYSINDTVVVYDRVRENLRKYKKLDLPELLDLSINETLARTTVTSLTTLLALGALYFLGGPVLRDFIFAMIFGVVIGTYSSIFVAAPLLSRFGVRRDWSGLGDKAIAGMKT